jgi:hypothetical protein
MDVRERRDNRKSGTDGEAAQKKEAPEDDRNENDQDGSTGAAEGPRETPAAGTH